MRGGNENDVGAGIRSAAKERILVLATAVLDTLLVAATALLSFLVNRAIGPLDNYALVDRITIIALQVVGAFSTVGPMVAYLVRDLFASFRKIRGG